MKTFFVDLRNKLSSWSNTKKTLFSICIITVLFTIVTFLFSISFKSFLYGYNFDWYVYISNIEITPQYLLLSLHPLGLLFDKIVSVVIGPKPIIFYILIIVHLYSLLLSFFFLIRTFKNNYQSSILYVVLLMSSIPFFSSFFEIRSCQVLFAPLFFTASSSDTPSGRQHSAKDR